MKLTAEEWARWAITGDPLEKAPTSLAMLESRITQAILEDRLNQFLLLKEEEAVNHD